MTCHLELFHLTQLFMGLSPVVGFVYLAENAPRLQRLCAP